MKKVSVPSQIPERGRSEVRLSRIRPLGRSALLGGIVWLVLLLAWWLATEIGAVDRFFLPSPGAVGRAAFDMLGTSSFWEDTFVSVVRILVGFVGAAILALPCGIAMGRIRWCAAMLTPPISFVRFVPMPAAIPLMILWFGSAEFGKASIIAAGVYFQLALMVADAVANVPRQYDQLAASMGATRWQRLRHFVLPSAAPEIWDSMRINFGLAWATLVFAEILGATSGLGFLIVRAQRFLLTEQVFVAVVVIGIFGILSDWAMERIGRAAFPWTNTSLRQESP